MVRGTIPTTGSPDAHPITMQALSRPLAEVSASPDASPRVIRQSSAIFLVTPMGDVWRIFDSDNPSDARFAATHDQRVSSRIFIGSGPRAVVRVYRFLNGEDRSTGAERLFDQLSESRASV